MWLNAERDVAGRQALLASGSTSDAFCADQNNSSANHGMYFDRFPEKEIGGGDGADRDQMMERADGERSQ